jgi:hypothetical protein
VPLYDSADLLARCLRIARRPATDQTMTPADWYGLLTEAQIVWMGHLATVAPATQYGAPVQLTTSDGGLTYDFPFVDPGEESLGRVFPVGEVEIRATRGGQLLLPCADWSDWGDFVPEGARIRMPGGRSRTFPGGGPWARYMVLPRELDASHEPVMQPVQARSLLPYRAVAKWARQGGLQDPQPFLDEEAEIWYGAPEKGVHGLLGLLKQQYAFSGNEAVADVESGTAWWRGMRTD